ncbi:hypothetical protein D2Q93_01135 [Alicyclobacillaceae bacterium I2511]|jgi:hypothetical protein|nr:hypothetical protein D2Q93_01135 [Alicyclobacillaceae bacterium I2511]
MNSVFPDWMIASIAIMAWSLSDWISKHWNVPHLRLAEWIVIGGCAALLVGRYVTRWIRRVRHPAPPSDPDEWKHY